jgi:hypothetical protein
VSPQSDSGHEALYGLGTPEAHKTFNGIVTLFPKENQSVLKVIESNQSFVEVCGKRFLTADFSHIEDDTHRTQSNGGPCYRVVLLNKPAVEIDTPEEVKRIAEWFRGESRLPGYLAIAPRPLGPVTAETGAPQSGATPARRGRKPGVRAKTAAA